MAMVGIIANTRQLHIATTLTPGSLEWQAYGKAGGALPAERHSPPGTMLPMRKNTDILSRTVSELSHRIVQM